MSDESSQSPQRDPLTEQTPASETIWRQRWFQWTLGVLVFAAMLTLVVPRLWELLYMTRPVLVPVLIALGLAYVFNPVVTFMHRRLRISRVIGTAIVLLSWLMAGLIILVLILPPLVYQGVTLIENIKDAYPQVMLKLIEAVERVEQKHQQQAALAPTSTAGDTDQPDPTASATDTKTHANGDTDTASPDTPLPATTLADDMDHDIDTVESEVESGITSLDYWLERVLDEDRVREMVTRFSDGAKDLHWSDIGMYMLRSLDIGVGVVGSAISLTTYLAMSAVIVVFCFFYFSWRLPQMAAWFVPYIPAAERERTLELVGRMDHTVSAFVRGRLIQVTILTVTLSIGWYLCGVPYFLLLGLLGGTLNLIPYAAVIAWPVAVLLASLDAAQGTNFSWLWAVILPTLVYMFAQGLDGWVIEPMVQGQATDLDPLTVLLVVLLGASVAGLLGMLLAIPVAACVKILMSEVLLPKLRSLASKY